MSIMNSIKTFVSGHKKAVIAAVSTIGAVAVVSGGVFAGYVIKERSSLIGTGEAERIALLDSGVELSNARFTKTELDFDDGGYVYEVEFYTDDCEYEYKVSAKDGRILEKETEGYRINQSQPSPSQTAGETLDNTPAFTAQEPWPAVSPDDGVNQSQEINGSQEIEPAVTVSAPVASDSTPAADSSASAGSQTASSNVSLDYAKEGALADCGLTAGQVTFTKAKLDYDDGIAVYDVEFYTDDVKYEYEVAAQGGDIVKSEYKLRGGISSSGGTAIGLDKAKEIALADSGEDALFVVWTETETDYDDGVMVYELEFYCNGNKHEYCIHSTSGVILERKHERHSSSGSHHSHSSTNQTGTGVQSADLELAKSSALLDAGLSSAGSGVSFTKATLSRDDGRRVYEIEFYDSDYKYEYKLDAEASGGVYPVIDAEYERFSRLSNGSEITYDQAKAIAAGYSGYSVSELSFEEVELDYDDGVRLYEIKFYSPEYEFECEISQNGGELISLEKEALR